MTRKENLMSLEPIVIDSIVPQEIPVKIGGQDYLLVEANGEASCAYRNMMLDNAVFENGVVKQIKNLANLEIFLLSKTLFKVEQDEQGQPKRVPVPTAVLQTWPGRLVTILHTRAKELSELEEQPKNHESPSEPMNSTAG